QQGRITLSEGKGLEVLGLQPGQAVGESVYDLYQGYPQVLYHIQQALTGKDIQAAVTVGEITFDTRYSPLYDENGAQIGITGVAIDITQRIRAETEILKTLQREKELNEMKSGFVNMVSHEFRTPLAVIQSATEIMHHYPLKAEEQGAYFGQIYTAVQHMTHLLEDVLLIGKLESGNLDMTHQWVDLSDLCRRVMTEIQLAYGQDYQFQFGVEGSPTPLLLDPKLIKQIFSNLLSNAVKYSPKGSEVRFTLAYQPNQVVLQVEDQGIGIPASAQHQLFEPFYRANNVGSIQGTGLGLAIVKRCVDLLGGTITVESAEMGGTTFMVLFPLNPQTVL
ncbi:MAG: ATP-binding protein, partial [Thermosynechococcaceae cyanobacterium]